MLAHRLPVRAHFDWALAVTFHAPAERLATLCAPGLELDVWRGSGFLAAAFVATRRLRPAPLPAFLGASFVLAGYRLFTRFRSPAGRTYRGLQILGSETDRRLMVLGGRLLTHYGYRRAATRVERNGASFAVATSSGARVRVDLDRPELPAGSVFPTWREARRYAGPMPWTFASEDGGRTVVRVEGVRTHWEPRQVAVDEATVPFLERLLGAPPAPAAAFLVEDVDYRWRAGIRERLQ